eukprot:6457099-Amphidinium_carterae.1
MGLLLHQTFVPDELPSCDVQQFMVACTCEMFSTNVRLIACYFPQVGHDLVDPTLFYQALEEVEVQLNEHDHCILLGDYNSWLGCSVIPGLPIGPFNLEKQNSRGVEVNHWLAARGLVVSSTFFPHAILETRCSSKSVSSLDYIATTSLVHSFFCAADVLPVASRSDHLLVRLQAKECCQHRRSRSRGKKKLDWGNPINIDLARQLLPTTVPSTLRSWRDALVEVSEEVSNRVVSVGSVAWKAWDTYARELRLKRNRAKGNERVRLSKMLYGYLRQRKVDQQLKLCKGRSLFALSKGRAIFQSVLVDANGGSALSPNEALGVFEKHLGSKVNAIPVSRWKSPFPIVNPSAVDGMFSGVAGMEPKTMRAKIGKGRGIDGIDPNIARVLPDEWLLCLPELIVQSYAQNDIVGTDLTLQRMRPIPKSRKRRLTVQEFRGVAVSGFPRMMMTMVLLHSLGQYLTH